MKKVFEKQIINQSFHGHGQPEPIGLEYIAASLITAGMQIQFNSPNELRVTVPGYKQGFSLFSATTAEYPHVCREAAVAKSEGRISIIGGYHACGSPQEALDAPFDYVITGEGEHACLELLRAIADGRHPNLPQIEKSRTGARHFAAEKITDLNSLPFPSRTKEYLGTYILYDLMWPTQSQQKNTAIVLASRGCAHACSFCASATVWGSGIRTRSANNVIKELQDLKSRFNTNTIVFIDQSLGQAKEWSIELCNAIENAQLDLSWYHQSNLDIDRNVLAAMARAGCKKIGFGMEGISPRSIERVKPINPQDIAEINDLFDFCNSLGIFVKIYLMIGFPWETEADIKEYLEHIGNLRANEIKISFLTPFPGTVDWERYSPNLISRDWTNYDTVAMPVVHNPNISVQQYYDIRTQLFRAFYGSQTYADVTQQILTRFPHYAESYREFLHYLKTFDMISGEEAWIDQVGGADEKTVYMPTPPQWSEI